MRLANYYKKFVANFNHIAKSLTMLTQNDEKWIWGDGQRVTFIVLKTKLASIFILQMPILGRPYQLHINWSTFDIVAVLTQMDFDAKEFVVAYANRSNNNAKAQYNLYEGECLAIVWAIAHF